MPTVKTMTADEALSNGIKQHSLDRSASSITSLAGDLVGLHNTSQASPYLSVRARLREFERTDLDDAMWNSWDLARFRAMRTTMFVFPHDLLEIVAAATRHLTDRLAERWLRDSGLTAMEFARLADEVEEVLTDGPRTVRDLRAVLSVPQSTDLPGIVARMCDAGRLVGGKPPGSWRSSVRRYDRWADVLPEVDLEQWDPESSASELVFRYIGSYGPVTVNDIAWWTGFTKQQTRLALEKLQVEEVGVDGWPGPLFRYPESPSEPGLGPEVIALPYLDPYVQGYRDRDRFLDAERLEFVYDGGGNAAATLVQNGRIVGVWQTSEDPVASVRFHLFEAGPVSLRRACEAELADAGSLYFDRQVDVVEIPEMMPLSAGGGRSAMHPLDHRLHRASRRQRK